MFLFIFIIRVLCVINTNLLVDLHFIVSRTIFSHKIIRFLSFFPTILILINLIAFTIILLRMILLKRLIENAVGMLYPFF